jgi:RNA polymerase sigma factor (TIGR02999 family)
MAAPSNSSRKDVREDITASVYGELKNIALARLRWERPGHTLQPTALVHEVCVRLMERDLRWEDRGHLICIAAQCMRHVLVDYARTKEAQKRGGNLPLVSLDAGLVVPAEWRTLSPEAIIDLDKALTKLHSIDDRQALIVELRFFAGMSEDEIALTLDISSRTVKRDWESARAWLYGQLRRRENSDTLET